MMCPTSVLLFKEMVNQLSEDRETTSASAWLTGGR
jgi:hypothetical protein